MINIFWHPSSWEMYRQKYIFNANFLFWLDKILGVFLMELYPQILCNPIALIILCRLNSLIADGVTQSNIFDSSRTAFAMSGRVCLTRYNNFPTPLLYIFSSSLDMLEPSEFLTIPAPSVPGVCRLLGQIHIFRILLLCFQWCLSDEALHLSYLL